jgi:FK506-binding protein 15
MDDDEITLTLQGGNPRIPTKQSANKLNSLFEAEEDWSKGNSSSLVYTAKRLQKTGNTTANTTNPNSATSNTAMTATPTKSSTSTTGSSNVIHAAICNLLKYEGNQPTTIGQRAITILRGTIPSTFVLVCYEPQTQKQDVVIALSETFTLYLSPPHYAMFYDDNKQYWCVQLANVEQIELLAKHIALVKNAIVTQHAANTNTPQTIPLIIQNLTPQSKDEQAVGNGDAVKVKYTMYLTSATHPSGLGTAVGSVGTDESPKQIKLGNRKELQGIEQGIVGMRKGERRFLVIPPHLGYGGTQAGSIPPNSTVVVDVTLVKVKFGNESKSNATTATAGTNPPVVTQSSSDQSQPQHVEGESETHTTTAEEDHEKEARAAVTRKVAAMGGMRMPGLPAATFGDHPHLPTLHHTPNHTPHHSPAVSASTAPVTTHPEPLTQTIVANPVPSPTAATPTHSVPSVQQHPVPQLQHSSSPAPHNPASIPVSTPSSVNAETSSYMNHTPSHPSSPSNHTATTHQYLPSPSNMQPQTSQPYSNMHASHEQMSYPYSHPSHHHPSHARYPSTHNYPPVQHMQQIPYSYNDPHHPQHHQQHHPMHPHYPAPQPASINPVSLLQLESKLDSMQTQLTRILGSNTTNLLYESPLTGAQLLKALNLILTERDEAKSKQDAANTANAELTARITVLQERQEKMIEEHGKQMERRYEAYQEELRLKNNQIADLQQHARKADTAMEAAIARKQEIENELTILSTQAKEAQTNLSSELASAKSQLESTQEQLQLANQELEFLRKQIAESQHNSGTEKEELQTTINDLHERLNTSQQESITAMAALKADLSATGERLKAANEEIEMLRTQLETTNRSVPELKAAHESELTSLRAELESEKQKNVSSVEEIAHLNDQLQQVIAEARARRESDKEQMAVMIEEVRTTEYERGQQETLEEVKEQIALIKEKAKNTIESLISERDELSQRVSELEEEKQEVIDASKQYVENMKKLMQQKIAESQAKFRQQEKEQSMTTNNVVETASEEVAVDNAHAEESNNSETIEMEPPAPMADQTSESQPIEAPVNELDVPLNESENTPSEENVENTSAEENADNASSEDNVVNTESMPTGNDAEVDMFGSEESMTSSIVNADAAEVPEDSNASATESMQEATDILEEEGTYTVPVNETETETSTMDEPSNKMEETRESEEQNTTEEASMENVDSNTNESAQIEDNNVTSDSAITDVDEHQQTDRDDSTVNVSDTPLSATPAVIPVSENENGVETNIESQDNTTMDAVNETSAVEHSVESSDEINNTADESSSANNQKFEDKVEQNVDPLGTTSVKDSSASDTKVSDTAPIAAPKPTQTTTNANKVSDPFADEEDSLFGSAPKPTKPLSSKVTDPFEDEDSLFDSKPKTSSSSSSTASRPTAAPAKSKMSIFGDDDDDDDDNPLLSMKATKKPETWNSLFD